MATTLGTVYLISVLFDPTEAERITGKKREIVVPVDFVLADDDEAARNHAVMRIPRDLDPDRCKVLVALPFGSSR